MLSDRAERAAAKAAAHQHQRVLHRLIRRDGLAIADVRDARKRQVVQRVHLLGLKWQRGRIKVQRTIADALHQRASIFRVGLKVELARHLGVAGQGRWIFAADLFVARKLDDAPVAHMLRGLRAQRIGFGLRQCKASAANIADAANRLTCLQSLRDLPDRPFAHAEHQQVRLGIDEDRAAHSV